MDLMKAFNEAINVSWDLENVKTDTEYNIYEDDEIIRIAFKGSTSKLDWLQNFSIWKKPYSHMKKWFFVHAGFLKKYKSVQANVMVRIKSAREKGKHVQIRGYSQGSAIAILCHEDVWFNYQYLAQTKIFGCPRVFSIFNGKEIEKRMLNVVRYQNGNDAVTKIPFLWMLFKHYGESINIGKKRRWWKLSIKDHMQPNYEESLN